MFCKHCAAPVEDNAVKCPSCGGDLSEKQSAQFVPVVPVMQQTYYVQPPQPVKPAKPFNGAKIAIGVLGIVLCVVVWMNSCVVSINDALAENGSADAVGGYILSFFMLVAGIVGVSSRASRVGAFVTGSLFLLGSTAGFITIADTYDFLPFWSFLMLCFGSAFIVFGCLHRKIRHG